MVELTVPAGTQAQDESPAHTPCLGQPYSPASTILAQTQSWQLPMLHIPVSSTVLHLQSNNIG